MQHGRLVLIVLAMAAGCRAATTSRPAADAWVNPSFAVGVDEARARLNVLAARPKVRLQRPLVICGGFLDVGIGPWLMRRTLARYVDGPIVCVNFATCASLGQARRKLVRAIDDQLGAIGDGETRAVDVIGQSLGGMIALYASLDAASLDAASLGKRLRIDRLYTICSPLRGARLATITPWNLFELQRDLRPGSALTRGLIGKTLGFELISYARLRDDTVGEAYEGLPNHPLWWVDTPPGEDAHDGADFDARILLDLALRLRAEPPATTRPPAPLPPCLE